MHFPLLLLLRAHVSKDAFFFYSMACSCYSRCSFQLPCPRVGWFLSPWTCPHQSTSLLPWTSCPLLCNHVHIWDWTVLHCEGLSWALWDAYRSLWAPPARCPPAHTCCDNQNVSDIARSPLGGKIYPSQSPLRTPEEVKEYRSLLLLNFRSVRETVKVQFLQYIRQKRNYNNAFFFSSNIRIKGC